MVKVALTVGLCPRSRNEEKKAQKKEDLRLQNMSL